MATIYPFRPLRPNPLDAGRLIFTKPQTESVAGENEKGLKPLKILLETGARQRPETLEGQAHAYADIRESLDTLIEQESLWIEQTPGIYIYESSQRHYKQTGIWALTDVADYASGNIRIHELTFSDSVRRIKNYRRYVGLEGSPVLLTYFQQSAIDDIIRQVKAKKPNIVYGNSHGRHRLWKVEDSAVLEKLANAFAEVGQVYLADGHHRLESALQLAVEQTEAGSPVFGKISSLYMSLKELRIERYDRVVIPAAPLDKQKVLRQLSKQFDIEDSADNLPVEPADHHHFGMLLQGDWYHLRAKAQAALCSCAVCRMDAAILQDRILAPIFGITDPKTDRRLKCIGGELAVDEIRSIISEHPEAVAFTLRPVTSEQLVEVADAGGILPPKSTWIVPKIPYGLLIQKH
jgi:uncharacterized protein (DUF1015 family)